MAKAKQAAYYAAFITYYLPYSVSLANDTATNMILSHLFIRSMQVHMNTSIILNKIGARLIMLERKGPETQIFATIQWYYELVRGCKPCSRVWILGEKPQVVPLIDFMGLLEGC
jgi:hypothetical protein